MVTIRNKRPPEFRKFGFEMGRYSRLPTPSRKLVKDVLAITERMLVGLMPGPSKYLSHDAGRR